MEVVSDADSLMSRGAAIFDQLRAGAPDGESVDPAPEGEADVDADGATVSVEEEDGSSTAKPADQPADEELDQPVVATDDEAPAVPAPVDTTPPPSAMRRPTMPDDLAEAGAVANRPAAAPDQVVKSPTGAATAWIDKAGHPLPRVIAVANQKGGVGKTTTAVNLGAALADEGYRTLVVDLDPQGNASTGLGINIRDLELSMYDVVIHEASIDDTIEATSMKNLFVAPASLDLAGAEIELVPAFSRELRLRHALAEVHDDYDYVLIDCPPSLGLLTVNGLAAASEVLVPIQCEYYALEGLGQLLRNVALVQRNLNPELEVSTVVCVMYDARTKLADQVVSEVREHFGEKVCRIVVPRTVRLSEAPSYGQPILAFDPRSRGAIAYRELAREVSGGARD